MSATGFAQARFLAIGFTSLYRNCRRGSDCIMDCV